MISLDVKAETTTSSSPLGLSQKEEEPTLSFSALLKGVSLKQDDKVIQNGALVLSLGNDMSTVKLDAKSNLKSSKNDLLLSLLKGNVKDLPLKATSKDTLPLELNPQLTQSLSVVELKSLIKDAKNYLKGKILASDDFKKFEVKELPKTLKGLAQMAKKFGIDVSKLTIEEVRVNAKLQTKQPFLDKVAIAKEEVKPLKGEPKVIVTDLAGIKTIKEEPKNIDLAGIKTIKEEPKNIDLVGIKTIKEEPKNIDLVRIKTIKEEPKNIDLAGIKTTKVKVKDKAIQQIVESKNDVKLQEQVKRDDKKVALVKEIKSTPLFKAQTPVEHTTEQVLQTKQFKVEHKTPKEKADETLKLLISGEKVVKNDVSLTSGFSVASAKVIAPKAIKETRQGLEKLLTGDKPDASETSKIDGLTVSKADSFEVKLNEAKQMVKYLSQDVKTAIEDYKSPFTRVKIQLNPQRLGEIDLTIVQRGKNLHINLSSNNTAINTLAMNANDLKVQLANSGINNASLNFNNNPQGDNSQSQQQQQRQNEQKANEEYNYFEKQEKNEEVLSSLEIVVPQYG